MEEPYFVYEEEGEGKHFSIQLTQAGWDKLSKREKEQLFKMVAGKAKDAKMWIHGRQSVAAGDWDELNKSRRRKRYEEH